MNMNKAVLAFTCHEQYSTSFSLVLEKINYKTKLEHFAEEGASELGLAPTAL
jgi:hypothetical protein